MCPNNRKQVMSYIFVNQDILRQTFENANTAIPDSPNTFYARFDRLNTDSPSKAPYDTALQVTHTQVLKALRKVNPYKAIGPEEMLSRVLKTLWGTTSWCVC